ncbi:carboxymuconolactone decarboxylase family protein [Ramlibacter sp. WS9]|uniref:carboxymuconolactone decarboxylase family protein n=1 Tax=Ramlibacter sp. WS9 TaxID=1882741 RepID=UPI001E52526E|nr:hypothetical protein [Ramlibacter sp. WS9]
MFLNTPADSEAATRLFQKDLDNRGHVMNLSRAWAWRPDITEAFLALRTQLTSASKLSQRELAVMVCSAAGTLGDSYCSLAWGKILAAAAGPSAAASVLRAVPGADLSEREQALARWARQVVQDPNGTGAQDVDTLRAAGLSDQEIFEATVFVAFRMAFSTVNDALGVEPDAQVAEAAPPEVREAVTFGRAVATA